MKLKLKFIIWLIFIWLTILTLCVIMRVEPNFVRDRESYMSVFVTAMGIAVALIIGFQIINVLDIKETLRKMREDYQRFQDKTNESLSEFRNSNKDFRNEIKKRKSNLKSQLIKLMHKYFHYKQAFERELQY